MTAPPFTERPTAPPPARARALAGWLLACGLLAFAASVRAQPAGATALHGQARLQQQGGDLLVTTGNGAGTRHSVIDWRSFSVPAGTTARFLQPDAGSTAINRVTGSDPSAILGRLSSNGRLVLVNPAGIAVGPGAVVDTAGFTASTLEMSDADALAGRLRFGAGSVAGALDVQGRILAREGDVVLLAPDVATAPGAIVQAPDGTVVLAAGRKVEITGRGLEGIRLEVRAPQDSVRNLGTLQADAVGLFAAQLQHSGLVQARLLSTDGRITLAAASPARRPLAASKDEKEKDGNGNGAGGTSADDKVKDNNAGGNDKGKDDNAGGNDKDKDNNAGGSGKGKDDNAGGNGKGKDDNAGGSGKDKDDNAGGNGKGKDDNAGGSGKDKDNNAGGSGRDKDNNAGGKGKGKDDNAGGSGKDKDKDNNAGGNGKGKGKGKDNNAGDNGSGDGTNVGGSGSGSGDGTNAGGTGSGGTADSNGGGVTVQAMQRVRQLVVDFAAPALTPAQSMGLDRPQSRAAVARVSTLLVDAAALDDPDRTRPGAAISSEALQCVP